MTVSQTTRLEIYKWTAGTDAFTRDQMTTSHDNLEAKAAGFNQAGSRPAAGAAYKGFVHYSSTDSSAGTLSYCNGTAWFNIGALSASTPTPLDGSASAGSSNDGSRADHKHAISNDAISNAMIADNAVQAAQLNADAVTTAKILNDNVTYAKIQNSAGFGVIAKGDTGSGDFTELTASNNQVLRRSGSGNLAFGTLVTANIGDDQITNDLMADDAINTAQLADGAVDADRLASNAVTTAKILAGNVTLSKIVDATAGYTILAKADTGSGDFAELAAGTNSVLRRDGSGDLAFGTIDSYHITNGAIMNTDINASAGIDASKLAANDIGDAQLDLDDCSFYAASGVAKAGNRVYIETGNATGGSNGDIWLKYTA
jgi:hypothetical protein